MQNLSVLFWLWKVKTDRRGKAPIYIRITIDGKQAQMSSGLKVEPEFFNQQKEQVTSRTIEAQVINQKIHNIRGQLEHQFMVLCAQSQHVHPEMLKETLLGKAQPKKTFMDIFDYHNTTFQQKVEAGKKSIATLKKYYATKEKLRAFLQAEYSKADISLADVKQTFPNDFEHYLSVYEHLQNNTIMKHIKNLKKILTLAVQKELIPTNPFQLYRCSYQTTARERLTEGELKKLMNTKFKRVALEEARDCYIAMCFTGYAYTDAFLLAPENIQVLDDGGRWFVKNREKTSGNENVPILPVVEQIIEKYKDHPYCLAYNKVFPIHSNQKFNAY